MILSGYRNISSVFCKDQAVKDPGTVEGFSGYSVFFQNTDP